MPSNKPILKTNTEQYIIDKMKYIAAKNSRSLAGELEYICKLHIEEYEQCNGEIKLNKSETD